MKLLLNTNVVSELRKAKTGKINPNVKAWSESVVTTQLFLSVVTLLELEMGIGLIERRISGSILRRMFNFQPAVQL